MMMMMRPRAGVYLRDDQLAVAVAGGRGGVQHFALDPGDIPGARTALTEASRLDPRNPNWKRLLAALPRGGGIAGT